MLPLGKMCFEGMRNTISLKWWVVGGLGFPFMYSMTATSSSCSPLIVAGHRGVLDCHVSKYGGLCFACFPFEASITLWEPIDLVRFLVCFVHVYMFGFGIKPRALALQVVLCMLHMQSALPSSLRT